MVHAFFFFTYIVVQISMVYSQNQDIYYPDNNNMVIGNLRRREVIPLNPFYSHFNRRRYGDSQGNLNYRRTKDIREDFIDRRFEMSETQLRESKLDAKEANLDKLHNELRWLTIDTEENIDQQPNVVFIGQR